MSRRADLLSRLADLRESPDDLMAELRAFPFDWDEAPLLVLSAEHFRGILDRYLSGDLSAAQLQAWAERLEGRDDVGFDPVETDRLVDLQFRLANPGINDVLTPTVAKAMRSELDSGSV